MQSKMLSMNITRFCSKISKQTHKFYSSFVDSKIELDTKLDFKDVLIKPKKGNIISRSQVNLFRTFKFKYYPKTWTGIPIIASNMDTVGTFESHKVLHSHHLTTAMHKHYSVQEWTNYANRFPSTLSCAMVSTGISNSDIEKLTEIVKVTSIDKICIDIANGYSQNFVDKVKKVRELHPDA